MSGINNPPSSAPSDHDGGGSGATVIGTSALADGTNATAYGDDSSAPAADGVAIGHAADSGTGADNVAIGSGSVANQLAVISVIDFSLGAGDTITLTQPGPVVTVLTEGVDFTAASSNAVTAVSIETAINLISGLTAVRTSAVVAVSGGLIDLQTGDVTAWTVALNLPSSIIAIGKDAKATTDGIAIGTSSTVDEPAGIAIGKLAKIFAGAVQSVAIGTFAGINAGASRSTAVGYVATASQPDAVCIGRQSAAGGIRSVAIGANTRSNGTASIAIGGGPDGIGTGADTPAQNSIGIGSECQVDDSSCIVMGSFAKSTASSQFVIGADGVGEITNCYFGQGVSGSIAGRTVRMQSSRVDTTVTDGEGTSLTLAAGEGTGDGTAAEIDLQTPDLVGAGTSQQTLATRLNLNDTRGSFTVPVEIPSFTVAGVPTATTDRMIIVSDDVGGLTLAYSDGTNWRRTSDRAIVSTT